MTKLFRYNKSLEIIQAFIVYDLTLLDCLVTQQLHNSYTTVMNYLSEVPHSLRSNPDGGNFDVSAIAQQYGGGGHRNAAGFAKKNLGILRAIK